MSFCTAEIAKTYWLKMINFVEQIAEDGLLAKRELNTPSVLHLFRLFYCSEMAEKICGIYSIKSKINPNKIYVGSAVDIKGRWACHVSMLKNNKHENCKLQRHFDKYGMNDLVFSVITICDREELKPIRGIIRPEQFFIWAYDAWFNICKIAHSRMGVKASSETRRKISKSRKGKTSTFKGKRHSDESKLKQSVIKKGKKQSPETVEKRAKQLRGRKQSSEHIRKRANALKGKPSPNKGKSPSIETREKLSKANKGHDPWTKGKHLSVDTIEKIKQKLTGQKRSESTKQKIREAARKRKKIFGRKHTEETKQKIRESAKRRWQKRA